MKYLVILFTTLLHVAVHGAPETPDSLGKKKVHMGAYAQVDYARHFGDRLGHNARLDVHRLVLNMGHNFSNRVSFNAEIEFEHVKEVEVEQAALQYRISAPFSLRAGLMLIPIGIINLYHEPPVFNGVERNAVASRIIPTTWSSTGVEGYGRLDRLSLRYQMAIVNSPLSYNGNNLFRGYDGMRKGRQGGAESIMYQPAITGRISYYGITGLKTAISGFFGSSQSILTDHMDRRNPDAVAVADSSIVGISMSCANMQYSLGRIDFRALVVVTQFTNSSSYNTFGNSDLGKTMLGYYGEIALHTARNEQQSGLSFFSRYEYVNTHYKVSDGTPQNHTYEQFIITTGVGWYPAKGTVVKVDHVIETDASQNRAQFINAGIGLWF